MNIRLKHFSATALFVLASIASLCGALFPNTASAAVNLDSAENKALSYSYYKVVESCFQRSNVRSDIESKQANSPSDWVNDSWVGGVNTTFVTGYLVNTEGKDTCKSLIPKAINFWQITPVSFLEGVGYKLSSDGSKYTRSSTQTSDVTRYITQAAPGTDGKETPLIKYSLEYAALTTGCKPSALGPIANITDEAIKRQINSNVDKHFAATLANADGSTSVHGFQGGSDGINNHGAPGTEPGSSSYDCRENGIARNVSTYAKALATSTSDDLYRILGNTLSSSLNTLKGNDCNSLPNAERTECQAGWQDTFNKCFATYQNTASLGAQNGPTGDTTTFAKPDDKALNTIALCVAKGTGISAVDIFNALKTGNAGFQQPKTTGIYDPSTSASSENQTNCVLEGIGWIVCPVVGFFATMTDRLYGWIQSYLYVQPLNVDTSAPDNTTYIAWSIMRNVANIAFVIAFLIIIYSQLTGAGISNYGIKKMLPRLVVAAILVNVSYWIVALALDLSNIVGNNLYNTLRNLPLGNVTITTNVWESVSGWLLAGGTGAAIWFGAVAIGGAGAWGLFAEVAVYAIIAFLLAVALALIVAFIILALRQALLIILIVISPLAFVAFLLPNTEKFFNTWKNAFVTLLIFYPLFSLLFGGSYAAGMIIIGSAGQGKDEAAVGMTVLLGMVITVLPLWLTPLIVRFSSGVLGQVAGMVNNKSRGLIDRTKKIRNRKAGLAMNETLGHPNNARNPFSRMYRRVQNGSRNDAQRQKIIDAKNQGAFLETQKASDLSTQLKNAEQLVQTKDAEHKAEFEVQKDVNLTYRLDLANQKVDVEKLYDKARFEESKSTSQAIGANNPLAKEIQEARDTQQEIDITNNRLNSAKGVLQQEFATELRNRPGMAMRAGGIDPQGSSKVVASAIEAQRKAYEGNVSAFEIMHADQSLNASRLIDMAKDANLSLAEREAAGRAVVKGGDIDMITPYQDYLAQELVSANGSGDATRIADIQALQKAYAATITSSPGKPMGLGAADVAQFATGSYQPPVGIGVYAMPDGAGGSRQLTITELQTLNTVESKGVSMDKWAAMDKADIKRVTELVAAGLISPQRLTDMKASIHNTRTDNRWSGRMQERELTLLEGLENILP